MGTADDELAGPLFMVTIVLNLTTHAEGITEADGVSGDANEVDVMAVEVVGGREFLRFEIVVNEKDVMSFIDEYLHQVAETNGGSLLCSGEG